MSYRVPKTPEEARTLLAEFKRSGDRRAKYVPLQLRALDVGESHVFPQYQRTAQISMAIQAVRIDTKRTFESSRELSLIDGECIGVRVTRIS